MTVTKFISNALNFYTSQDERMKQQPSCNDELYALLLCCPLHRQLKQDRIKLKIVGAKLLPPTDGIVLSKKWWTRFIAQYKPFLS